MGFIIRRYEWFIVDFFIFWYYFHIVRYVSLISRIQLSLEIIINYCLMIAFRSIMLIFNFSYDFFIVIFYIKNLTFAEALPISKRTHYLLMEISEIILQSFLVLSRFFLF